MGMGEPGLPITQRLHLRQQARTGRPSGKWCSVLLGLLGSGDKWDRVQIPPLPGKSRGLLKSCFFSIPPSFTMGIRLLALQVQLWRGRAKQCVIISGLEVTWDCYHGFLRTSRTFLLRGSEYRVMTGSRASSWSDQGEASPALLFRSPTRDGEGKGGLGVQLPIVRQARSARRERGP